LEKWTLSGNHGSIHTINTEKNYRSEGNDRAFKAFAGVHMAVAEKIFLDHRHFVFLPTRDILLMVLHFLKAYLQRMKVPIYLVMAQEIFTVTSYKRLFII
jgi:hypothetical protein